MQKMEDISKLVTGNLEPEKRKEVLSEIDREPEQKEFFRKLKVSWAFMSSSRRMPEYQVEKSYQELQSRIRASRSGFWMNPLFRYAAILVLIAGISTVMYYLGKSSLFEQKAQLQYTSVVADYGQISKVVLPDSTVIWLNSGTTLTYNNHFAIDNRDLTLKGQAYLEVAKNKHLPLIVSSGDLNVKVLGTKFDVDAYPDEKQIEVVLKCGSVELSNSKIKSFKYRLKPGEKADYNLESKDVAINKVDLNHYFAWKDGEMVFKDTPMNEVLKTLERKFNVEFEIKNPAIYKSLFTATFKKESLREILDYIHYTSHIKYTITDNANKTKIVLN
jgi:ferric-dicitrate binding protein FerR (iron transport regulator)